MPKLIEQPTVIQAAGNKPKRIEEYAGRVVAHQPSSCGKRKSRRNSLRSVSKSFA
jgi:hypothetical protein